MTIVARTCSQPTCKAPTTGVCELHRDPLESCPNFTELDEETVAEADQSAAVENPKESDDEWTVASSDAMTQKQLNELLAGAAPQIVSLVGEHDAGKTTLLAALYGAFCEGPVGNFRFAGSRTLIGFDKRFHRARTTSESFVPATPRTSRDDPVYYFHLSLRDPIGELGQLVISDRSGEIFSAAREDTTLVGELTELKQADRVAFVLDGKKLCNPEERHVYIRHFKQMIHALNDNGALEHAHSVETLLTKIDLVKTVDKRIAKDVADFVNEIEWQIAAEMKSASFNLSSHRICAMPKAHPSMGLIGIAELLKRWMEPGPLPDIAPRALRSAAREIDKLDTYWVWRD